MRKLIYAINITLDGCCDHTKMRGSEEMLNHYTGMLRDVDEFVYGRKTYQLMVPYWPNIAKNHAGQRTAEIDFAEAFDSKKIVVFSQSLDKAEGKNTRIVHTNVQDEILRLKQEPGKAIMAGGVALPSRLIELGLVDEFRFVVQPILAGEGRRLLEGLRSPEKLQFKLVESNTFESGSVALRYLKL